MASVHTSIPMTVLWHNSREQVTQLRQHLQRTAARAGCASNQASAAAWCDMAVICERQQHISVAQSWHGALPLFLPIRLTPRQRYAASSGVDSRLVDQWAIRARQPGVGSVGSASCQANAYAPPGPAGACRTCKVACAWQFRQGRARSSGSCTVVISIVHPAHLPQLSLTNYAYYSGVIPSPTSGIAPLRLPRLHEIHFPVMMRTINSFQHQLNTYGSRSARAI